MMARLVFLAAALPSAVGIHIASRATSESRWYGVGVAPPYEAGLVLNEGGWERVPCETDAYASTSYMPEVSVQKDWLEVGLPVRGTGVPMLSVPATDQWVGTCIRRKLTLMAGRRYLWDMGNARPGTVAQPGGWFPVGDVDGNVNMCDGTLGFLALAVDDMDDEEYGVRASHVQRGCMYARFWVQPTRTREYTVRTYARCVDGGLVTAGCTGNFGVWRRREPGEAVAPAPHPPATEDGLVRPPEHKIVFCNPLAHSALASGVHCTFVHTHRDTRPAPAAPFIIIATEGPPTDITALVVFDADAESAASNGKGRFEVTLPRNRSVHAIQIRGALRHNGHASPTARVQTSNIYNQNVTLAFSCDGLPCGHRIAYVYAESVFDREASRLWPGEVTPTVRPALSMARPPVDDQQTVRDKRERETAQTLL